MSSIAGRGSVVTTAPSGSRITPSLTKGSVSVVVLSVEATPVSVGVVRAVLGPVAVDVSTPMAFSAKFARMLTLSV